MTKKRFYALVVLPLLAGLFLPACNANKASTELPVLKLALIPVLDTLPIHVAQNQGFFEKHGVKVEIIPVGSAPERDQLIVANQADGIVNEALSTMFFNKEEIKLVTVRYARAATAQSPLFSILAAKDSPIQTAADLQGVQIGISQGTVIEYLTERLLQAAGLTASEIATTPVPKIDVRMSLLSTGELKAAMLPEPFTSLAIQQGARIVIDDSIIPELSFSTLAFRKTVLDQQPAAMRAFLAAFEEAVQAINADPARWGSLMSEQKLVPASLSGSFKVPSFVAAGVPTEAQWADVLAWAKDKGLIERDISYQDSVDASFLP